ncbi:MAG: tRNA preQ1(34) S-adenosylmethionine ribosyltransferase-isomerase QueA [Thermodesulfovibrio sp.]|nr:tRNA preQ1(34) S-adenosylmethionine ribosyltransferase-isomerase QueA [Thermodesulfovibrio sp.]MDW7998965.1 tRNA preQ1(34) S-adenosylmethionine ribosyltransferase-isomerase QueA [Thermodesulfovibrio sp.]
MKINDLNYTLPKELIAQEPLKERDKSRLLVLHKKTGEIEHKKFYEIVDYINEGDIIVINNTRVIPAKIIAKKPSGGKLEILLIKERDTSSQEVVWEIMTKGKYEGLVFIDDIEVELRNNNGERYIIFKNMKSQEVKALLEKKGVMPLPPYIKRKPNESDKLNYQTVYAKVNGSIAAPTAGLHFTDQLLQNLVNKGVKLREITLHVGIGTFKPIKVERLQNHKMESEYFEINRNLIEEIYLTKKSNKKIFLVGTTTTRALEGFASGRYKDLGSDNQTIRGITDIFIYPGFSFKIADSLITNFHSPMSTPLALVYAFCEMEKVKNAYKEAIEKGYRFFSYGDAMLII